MVFGTFERMVAMRYLRARREEGFISVIAGFSLLGIALGVGTLIVVMAVMNGFRHELLGRILGVNGHVTVYAQTGKVLTDYDALTTRIQRIGNVVTATPLVEGQVMVTSRGQARGALVRGMRPEDFAKRKIVAGKIVAGKIQAFGGSDVIFIGEAMASNLGLGVDDSLTLISPRGNAGPFGTIPRLRAYRIAGIFKVGMYEYDNSFVYMPMQSAQVFFQTGDGVSAVEVLLDDPEAIGTARPEILQVAGSGYRVVDWQAANRSFFTAIEVERNVMFLILTLIIVVAAFNIISSMIMLVKDKGRDIAILRTMGASRGMIMRIFFMSGASVGVIGTILGFILGVLFADNIENMRQWLQELTGTKLFDETIYFLSRLPARIDPNEVIAVVAMSLTLSFLATIYPSWRAARLDPVEALRYE